jgi:GTP cyclohydrolase III
MGRLIDVDELLARIRLNYNNHQNITACAMKDIINTTKTAYDIEKVVAELEEYKSLYAELQSKHNNANIVSAYVGKEQAIDCAIDIVRKGGVE